MNIKLTQVERKLYKLFMNSLDFDKKCYSYLMSNQFIDYNKFNHYIKMISKFNNQVFNDIKYTNNGSLLIIFKNINYSKINKILKVPVCLLLDYDEVEYYLAINV